MVIGEIRSFFFTFSLSKADSFVGKCMLRATTFLGFSVSLYQHFHSFVIKGSKNLRGKLFTLIVFLVFLSKVRGEKRKQRDTLTS